MIFKEIKRIPYAKGITISPDGQTIIAMSGRTTRVISMADDMELAAFRDLQGAYRAAFSPDREIVAVKTDGSHWLIFTQYFAICRKDCGRKK